MSSLPEPRPKLSVIVVCYEMTVQIERTLQSLLPPYQRGIRSKDYEIILIDNGSREPLPARLQSLASNLRYEYIPPHEARPSPAAALNRGVGLARAPIVSLMIDGARMVTPGVLSWALRLLELAPEAMVEVRGWHLGPGRQNVTVPLGYNSEGERKLLDKIQWQENGYRLWDIAAATPQTKFGYSAPTAESNCLFLSRELFASTGGYDERTTSPGGGWLNLDFFARAVAAARCVFTLLGEGTFHQVHGGAATSLCPTALAEASKRWKAESVALGQTIAPEYEYLLAGHLPRECAAWLAREIR